MAGNDNGHYLLARRYLGEIRCGLAFMLMGLILLMECDDISKSPIEDFIGLIGMLISGMLFWRFIKFIFKKLF